MDESSEPQRNLLDEDVKLFIVEQLACFRTPAEVQALLQEEFGVKASTPQIARYNPTKIAGKGLSDELKAIFESLRKAFLTSREEIAIAHQNFRLRELDDMHRIAKSKKMLQRAAAMLEQAAKEEGGMFTNRRVLETPQSGPENKPLNLARLNAEELAEMKRLVAKATDDTGDPGGGGTA